MSKILKFLKSFYMVFSVCVLVVVAVTASFVFKYAKEQNMKKMALYTPSVYIEKEDIQASSVKSDIKQEQAVALKKDEETSSRIENNEIKKVMPVLNEEFTMDMPVKGSIINKFSKDELIYSKTFEDYRVHNGIDIKCERGKAVFSVYDGVVEEVYTDAMEGIVIVVNHRNGYKSVYKNLSNDKMVKKGESVVKGQAISGVGETAIFEAAEESHIHFELLYNGNQVNPEEYFN